MTERNVSHAVFTIERTYPVPPSRVYAAFADQTQKDRWFARADGLKLVERRFDFREGGEEVAKGLWPNGTVSHFDCRYQNIVPDERIVYVYNMHLDDRLISVSLATIEFKAAAGGTKLVLTEQGAYLDGYDDAGSREHGTNLLIDKMGETLQGEAAEA